MDYKVALAGAIVGDEKFGQGLTVGRSEWLRRFMVVAVVNGRAALVKSISDDGRPDPATQPASPPR